MFFSAFGKYEQNIDSLEIKLILAQNQDKPSILNKISSIQQHQDPLQALKKAEFGLKLAQQENLKKEEAKALLNIAEAKLNLLCAYEAALDSSLRARQIFRNLGSQTGMINSAFLIGTIYSRNGDYSGALENYTEAAGIAARIDDKHWQAKISLEIGSTLAKMDLPMESGNMLKNALKLYNQLNDQPGIAETLDRLSMVYLHNGNSFKAYANQEEALKIRRKLEDPEAVATSLFGLGKIHFYNLKLDSTYFYYQQSLDHLKNTGNLVLLTNVQNAMGELFLHLEAYEHALQYLKEAENQAQKVGKMELKYNYEKIYECYLGMRDYKNALIYKENFANINDFIFSENLQKASNIQTRQAIEDKERELEILKKDIDHQNLAFEKQKDFKNFLVILSLLLAVIIGMSVVILRNKIRHNRQLQIVNQKVLHQNEQLKELNATKDRFFSIIGHDLRSPLNSLSSFSDLLINHTHTLTPHEIKMVADNLNKSVKNLHNLLENLLIWSTSQSTGMQLKPENVSLNKLVEENILLFEPTASHKKIQLINKVPADFYAFCDQNTTRTIIRNLVANALKFTGEGGSVIIKGSVVQDQVELAVSDTGIGMDDQAIQKLFKLDKKQSTPGTANEKGTGLGLILCKDFVEQNGGKIKVVSKPGEGSCFSFTLPVATIEPVLEAAMF